MIRNPNIPKLCINCAYCPKEENPVRKDSFGICTITIKTIFPNTKGCLKGKLK